MESDVDFYLDRPGKIKSMLYFSGFRIDLKESLGKDVNLITAMDESSIFWSAMAKEFVTVYGELGGDAGRLQGENIRCSV